MSEVTYSETTTTETASIILGTALPTHFTIAKVLDSHHPKTYNTEHKCINFGLVEGVTWK
jgi:hypothetical protein